MPSVRSSTRPACAPSAAADGLVARALAEAIDHHRAGRLGTAAELYGAILEIDPQQPDALHLAGVVAHQHGRHALALALIERALALVPGSAEAHNSLGAACRGAGDDAAAEASFRRALALAPRYPDALQNLGQLLEQRGELATAIDCYRRAWDCGARNPALLVRHGLALCADDRASEACGRFAEALQHDPDHVPALLGLGEAHYALGELAQAHASFRRAAELDPEAAPGWIGLGTVAMAAADWAGALECFDRVLAREPQHAQARWNRALACLAAGDLAQGWRDFGWRWASRDWDTPMRHPRCARWQGTPLEGRALLLWREQGIGEELLLASLLPQVEARVRHCVLECDPRLQPLFARSFPALEVVAAAYPPHPATARAFDWHAPIGDLAPVLRPTLASFPSTPAYLRADPAQVRAWRERLAALGPGPWVGLCWRSSNQRGIRAAACTRIEQWPAVLAVPGARFVNLQYDGCEQELAWAAQATGRAIVAFPELDMRADLDATAALIAALDLVVSAPTAMSILAAALGVPTWQLTCGADWHALGQTGSPWQPRLTRFYRRWDERWEPVLQQVAAALAGWADEYRGIDRSARGLGAP